MAAFPRPDQFREGHLGNRNRRDEKVPKIGRPEMKNCRNRHLNKPGLIRILKASIESNIWHLECRIRNWYRIGVSSIGVISDPFRENFRNN